MISDRGIEGIEGHGWIREFFGEHLEQVFLIGTGARHLDLSSTFSQTPSTQPSKIFS